MSPDKEEIRARRKTPPTNFKWWSRSNTVEVARWLAAHGKSGVQVGFRHDGHTLSINGYTQETPGDGYGLWISENGDIFTDAKLTAEWEVMA